MRPLAFLLLLAACAAPPAPPAPLAPATAPPTLPAPAPSPLEGCPKDFTGLWRHSQDDGYRYLARDDGGVVVLDVRHAVADGGFETAQLVLVRSPSSFLGAVAVAHMHADAGCVAFFPVEVVQCADGGVVLSTVERLRVDADCRAVAPGVYHQHRLVRVTQDGG